MRADLPWAHGGQVYEGGELVDADWVWSYSPIDSETGSPEEDTRLFSAPPEVAARVVRAVNCHDDLLEALATLIERCDHYAPSMGRNGDLDQARAAIAKARGR